MTQQAPAQQTVREEERVLGITYDRALAMVPRLIRSVTGGEVEALGDGYFVVKTGATAKREMTVRLGRQSADTRFSVRVETYTSAKMLALIIAVAILTAGIGMVALIPWMLVVARREARERDLLVHKMFRAIEDEVAEQGVAGNYRVAPGADAPMQEEDAEALDELAASKLGVR